MTVAGQCPSCGRTFTRSSGHCPDDGTRIVATAPAPQDTMVGRVLDMRFEVKDLIAAGKVGSTYRGWQISVAREVAIKIIHPAFTEDRAATARFAEAAKLACQLVAPAIANTYDFGTDDIVYVVGELIRGRALEGEVKRGTVSHRRVVGIALQLCDALEAAHRLGAIHGDLKPANVLVDETGAREVVKVVDFGLARALSPPGSPDPRRGLPLYTAPEVLDGSAGDVRSDLYALGCILHELIAGAPPFHGATFQAVVSRHKHEAPPALPPNVPTELVAIVKQLLAKAPEERFATSKNVRARLLALQAIVGLPDARPSGRMHAPTGGPYTRDPTTPPSQGPWSSTTPPSTPPSQTPWSSTTPPSTPPSQGPWSSTTPPSTPPSQGPWSSATPPPVEGGGGSRILVIAIVAIVISAGGIAALVLL